jgi:hypothetical protein
MSTIDYRWAAANVMSQEAVRTKSQAAANLTLTDPNEIQSRTLLVMVPEIDIIVPGKLNFPSVVFESPVPPQNCIKAMAGATVRTKSDALRPSASGLKMNHPVH